MSDNTEQTSIMDLGLDLSGLASLAAPSSEESTPVVEEKETDEPTEPVEEPEDKVEEPEKKEEVPSEETPEEVQADSPWGQMAQEAVDSGLLSFEEEGEYEDSKEGFIKLVEENLKKKETEVLQTYRETLPEEGVKLIDHLEKGYTVEQFVEDQKEYIDYDSILLDTEENQQMVVEYSLEKQGVPNNEIASQVAAFKEAGLLEQMASSAKTSLKAIQDTEIANKETKRASELELQQAREEEQRNIFKAKIENTRDVKGIKVSENEAKELHDYITKPVGPNGETQFTIDDAKDENNRLLYAMLVKKGFDFKKLEAKAQARVNFKLKKSLDESKTIGASSSTNTTRKEVSDNTLDQAQLGNALKSLAGL